jgi:hypothetical protein
MHSCSRKTIDAGNAAQMKVFASAVAAAAAAGAMTALQKLPAAHLQPGSGEQHEAFMTTARLAASAAALQATSMLPQPFHNCMPVLEQHLPEEIPCNCAHPRSITATPSCRGPSQQADASADMNGRVRQILDHPVAGNAARTKSDGSAHLPGAMHAASRQIMRRCLIPPDTLPMKRHIAKSMESFPDCAESLDMTERCETVVSRAEQSLIKRLQLYAWVVCSRLSLCAVNSFCANW